jgi:2-dehydro-3-deoxyphosphogluconate aldolase/(4S)-4-hydroxy-2-oxoglutarate aldolase
MFEKDHLPILGILRGIKERDIEPLAEVCIKCGLDYLEITMNTEHAPNIISKMINVSRGKIIIGAGTVLSSYDLELALNAGARFIVCPSINSELIKRCVDQKVPVFPGALTPTEVQHAWDKGATMVKLFPASLFGPSYIKELKGPFDKIKIMAVGGVTENNIYTFFENGADAVAFGSSIFNLEWMKDNRYENIEAKMHTLFSNYKK